MGSKLCDRDVGRGEKNRKRHANTDANEPTKKKHTPKELSENDNKTTQKEHEKNKHTKKLLWRKKGNKNQTKMIGDDLTFCTHNKQTYSKTTTQTTTQTTTPASPPESLSRQGPTDDIGLVLGAGLAVLAEIDGDHPVVALEVGRAAGPGHGSVAAAVEQHKGRGA